MGKKYFVWGLVIVGMIAFAGIFAINAVNGHDPVWIDGNGNGQFDPGEWNGTSIQDAIDNASDYPSWRIRN